MPTMQPFKNARGGLVSFLRNILSQILRLHSVQAGEGRGEGDCVKKKRRDNYFSGPFNKPELAHGIG